MEAILAIPLLFLLGFTVYAFYQAKAKNDYSRLNTLVTFCLYLLVTGVTILLTWCFAPFVLPFAWRLTKFLIGWTLSKFGKPGPEFNLATPDQIHQLEEFLQANPDKANSTDGVGRMPIHYAAENGFDDVVRVLLANGAGATGEDRGSRTPMHFATTADIVKQLLARGARVDPKDCRGMTPVFFAADTEVFNALLAAGADVNVVAEDGFTPLHTASEEGRTGVVRKLIDMGLDAGAPIKQGATPLHFAAAGGHAEIINELVKAGAGTDIQQQTFHFTPLHRAIRFNRYEAARALLKAGADWALRDTMDRTAIDLAEGVSTVEMVSLLEEFGAKRKVKPNPFARKDDD